VLRRYVPAATLPTSIADQKLSSDAPVVERERLSHNHDLADGGER
jgi:hypothetical protein